MGNYSFKTKDLPKPDEKGVVEGHNFTQGTPHTKIYEGMKGLTFRNCNLLNCDVPGDAIVKLCNTGHMTFCSHIWKGWLDKGYISECATECDHVIVKDTITIDGIVVDTSYKYEDKVVV